jgi:hypothetical protein
VSELQHSRNIALPATFSPTECLMAPVSYLPRAAPDGMESHADFGPSSAFGGRGTVVLQSPRSRYLIPSARDRGIRS